MKHANKTIQLTTAAFTALASYNASAAALSLYQSPLFLTSSAKANVLVILDNSNSMDEAANGSAVGSASPNSKSEIARKVVRSKDTTRSVNPDDPADPAGLIDNYLGKINLGLMAYQQESVEGRHLHNSAYDASFNPANFDPDFTGPRDSLTKKYSIPNATDPGASIYYNVALPFYADNNFGNAFCYSPTADFDNGAETFPGGPWDNYRCFETKVGSSDALPIWGNTVSENAAGYFDFWFQAQFFPTDSDLAQNILDFGRFLTWNWVSRTWFSNSSPGRGYLHVPIADLDAAQAQRLNNKLAPSQFDDNNPTDPDFPLQNAGLTPIEGTLLTAKDYFEGNLSAADEGGPVSAPPNSCGKNFVALLTDGLPSTDKDGDALTNPAAAIAAAADAANELLNANIETYVIGFALPYGTDPTTLDSIASAGGTSSAFMADDPVSLKNAFDTIFNDILAKTGASSSAATNSTSLSSDSIVYQARFSSADWSGQLLAKPIDLDGTISGTISWDAANLLNAKDPNDRVIITLGRDTMDGIPFRWSDISAQTDSMATDALNMDHLGTADGRGEDRVDFLRGGTGGASASFFRTDRNGKLGDIVHSTPNFVGTPSAGYNDAEMPGYSAFQSTYSARTPAIYTGANDGMLHGFNADTGEEILAYVPSKVYKNLNKLTAPGYGASLPHQYFVDGSPAIADADVNGWKTVLIGGLNAGGQGLYALDISNPTTFSESNADDIVLWEFTDEDDADLGYTFFEPTTNLLTYQSAQIVKMNNNKWAVILGNGYNNTESDGNASSDGHGYLFILFIEGGMDGSWTLGSDYIKIDTGVGSTTTPNGLATPIPNDIDGDGKVDTIYAGDLYGNLWKFDVRDPNPSNWEIAFPGGQPLFSAEDSSNNAQPITSTPILTPHPLGGYMIGFGTGKYMELSDNSDTSNQTIYGIWDNESIISSRINLLQQNIVGQATESGVEYRINSSFGISWGTHQGWFIDLPEAGERVDVNPIIRDGRFVFVTRTPSSDPCSAGGESWLMELNYLNGGYLDTTPFDVNNDGVLDSDDYIDNIDVNGDGTVDDDDKVPVSGRRDPSGGMVASPTVITDANDLTREFKVLSSSTGSLKTVEESADARYRGRISWEELR